MVTFLSSNHVSLFFTHEIVCVNSIIEQQVNGGIIKGVCEK